MALPIAGDTFISGDTYYHILTIATVDNEPLAIVSTTTKSQDYPIYARNPETEEILMIEGSGVRKVQRVPSGEDENTVLPLSAFSETLPGEGLRFVKVEWFLEFAQNQIENEPAAESVEPVTEPVESISEPVVEPETVPHVEATVESVEKTEDTTEVEVAVSVPDEADTVIQE